MDDEVMSFCLGVFLVAGVWSLPLTIGSCINRQMHESTIAAIANGEKRAVRVDLPDGTVRYFVVDAEKKEEPKP